MRLRIPVYRRPDRAKSRTARRRSSSPASAVGLFGAGQRRGKGLAAAGAQERRRRREGGRRAGEKLPGESVRLPAEPGGLDRARREAGFRRLPARERPAGQDPVRGARLADPFGQERRGPGRKAGEADFRKADAGVHGGQNDVTGRGDLGSASQARAGHGGDGHGARRQERRQGRPHRREHPLDRFRLRIVLGDRDAGREGPRQPRDHQDPRVARLGHDARQALEVCRPEDVDGGEQDRDVGAPVPGNRERDLPAGAHGLRGVGAGVAGAAGAAAGEEAGGF